MLLCSATGYDVSGRVEDLAVEMNNKDMVSIAIGSAEGFDQADKALHSASRSGRWMLLKNVHLAPDWLTQLEKKLHSIKPHPQFRLLLTAEINSRLPVSIIQVLLFIFFYNSKIYPYTKVQVNPPYIPLTSHHYRLHCFR